MDSTWLFFVSIYRNNFYLSYFYKKIFKNIKNFYINIMDELSRNLNKIERKIQKYNEKKYLLLIKHPKFQIDHEDNI